MEIYQYEPGTVPLVVSIPHAGTFVPDAIRAQLTDAAAALPDTDWHVDRLYGFAREMGAHILKANSSRYVIDLNRDPTGATLYPGKFNTGLCPHLLFDTTPLYRDGSTPDEEEVRRRTSGYWWPYHRVLEELLEQVCDTHGHAVLLDAHSIRSEVPALFEGRLPDINIGTADGASADAALSEKLLHIGEKSPYSTVLNGRFKGGYITRHYGKPHEGIHAVQIELTQCNYMNEAPPYAYDEEKAVRLQNTLREMLTAMVEWTK
ncbi:MAG: N-formylglutamate deformylase [Alphaproteobacteria bacterium]|nr:N-formylglutamate deformylase [Alphaproteobacteria bacterium]